MRAVGRINAGKTAERIGLVLKAVPAAELEKEVNSLAETVSKIPLGLIIAHKRIANLALDIAGRGMVQRLAAEYDAVAHLDPMVLEFSEISQKKGLKAALDWRDSRFGDYRTSDTAKKAREQRG